MPIPLLRTQTQAMAARFAEAAELVAGEFRGLDRHDQYRNAFARVMKWDPLGRVLMMGTDQRDLFVPLLRRIAAEAVRPDGQVFDAGCGDGQTFALLADALPPGCTVAFADPNADYVRHYGEAVARAGLARGAGLVAGFEEIDAAARRTGAALPADGTVDLVLAIHMIYFLPDLEAALRRMYRFLRPGGVLAVVVADEAVAYTGVALEAWVATPGAGCSELLARQRAALADRARLFGGGLVQALAAELPGSMPSVEIVTQPSRLYGHSLADVVAMANIAALSEVGDIARFEAVVGLLRDAPERVDLSIENDGPRAGMLSVAQPQTVAIVRRGA